eukprot:12455283-Alexandrium_andersonii.AAC.1
MLDTLRCQMPRAATEGFPRLPPITGYGQGEFRPVGLLGSQPNPDEVGPLLMLNQAVVCSPSC